MEKLGRSIVSKKERQIAFEMNCSFIVRLLKSVFYSYTSENEQTGLFSHVKSNINRRRRGVEMP